MYNALEEILRSGKYTVVEEFSLPTAEARYREIPRFLFDSRVGLSIHATLGKAGGLWNHQAVALERIGEGANVVVSTGTASGKSLIFRSAAFHRALLVPLRRSSYTRNSPRSGATLGLIVGYRARW
jgi:DEAD/DEAH box helicase domain-containing protein